VGELGLNQDEVVSNLQAWTREVFGLDRPPPIIPHAAQVKLGLGNNHHPSYSHGGGGGGMCSYGIIIIIDMPLGGTRKPFFELFEAMVIWRLYSGTGFSYGQQRSSSGCGSSS